MSSEVKQPLSEPSPGAARSRPARWQGWLIIGLLAGGMALAYLVFPRSAEDRQQLLSLLGTNNKGDLVLPPRQLQDIAITRAAGEMWLFAEQKPRWRLLLPVAGDCSGDCRQLLYLARQVHRRLAEKAPRVERLLLNTGPPFSEAFAGVLQQEYPGIKPLAADQAALNRLLQGAEAAPGTRLYIVDPAGFVMMSYGLEHPGGDILKDLKRLLKFSKESQ